MFTLAIFIGIYSYLIFSLGILGLIYKPVIFVVTSIWILILLISYHSSLKRYFNLFNLRKIRKNKFFSLILLIILIQALVNLVGVFGPEISFDALWYHLTLPKLYVLNHQIMHIPGNQLFYSDMPKLMEMLYTPALALGNELFAKFIHYVFGILILIGTYKVARKYVSKEFSILASAIFYANLVVGWETITGYIDLSRTFFELMAFWGFLEWWDKKDNKWLILTSIMVGLAITTKLVAVGSILIFLCLFIYKMFSTKEDIKTVIKNFIVFIFTSLLIPLPWFVFFVS